jgi:hypothetical protein
MSTRALEAFLARLYTDAEVRREFLADPRGTAVRAQLEPAQIDALVAIDRVGLELAAASFEKKRAARSLSGSALRRALASFGRYLSSHVYMRR